VFLTAAASTLLWAGATTAAEVAPIGDLIQDAMAADIRSDKDRRRDQERKPVETLEFFGLQADMSVLEIFPGSGWYTKILGNVLKESGKLHLAIGSPYLKDSLEKWGFDHVNKLAENAFVTVPSDRKYVFDLKPITLGVTDLDMVVTFRNAHNLTPKARAMLNAAVFDALKPGGVYGVIDHTRRHMEPTSDPVWRRADPVLIIKEALDAGFEFEAFSDLHHQPADGLIYDTVHKSLNRNSDRFTLKFRKPR